MIADILIVGCGVAGLYCALNLPRDKNIIVVTKNKARRSDSFLAQGGICVLRDEQDYKPFYEDTMRAGHYENNPDSVDIMIRSSQQVIEGCKILASLVDMRVCADIEEILLARINTLDAHIFNHRRALFETLIDAISRRHHQTFKV